MAERGQLQVGQKEEFRYCQPISFKQLLCTRHCSKCCQHVLGSVFFMASQAVPITDSTFMGGT